MKLRKPKVSPAAAKAIEKARFASALVKQAKLANGQLAKTEPAAKTSDLFPSFCWADVCRTCYQVNDCSQEKKNGLKAACPEFGRLASSNSPEVEMIEAEKEKENFICYDKSHLFRKESALQQYLFRIEDQINFHREEIRRLEAKARQVEKDFSKVLATNGHVTKLPSHLPAKKFFVSALADKAEANDPLAAAKAEARFNSPKKTTPATKAVPKKTLADWLALEI